MEKQRKAIVILIVCLQNTVTLYAQWTKEDSVWLENVKSGKEQIQLNPEFMKAIEEGTFINPDDMSPKKLMKPGRTVLPISKDFSVYIKPDTLKNVIDIWSIPPAVFMRYGLDIPLLEDKFNKAAFAIPQTVKDNAAKPSGRSFNDMWRSAFSPEYRARERNRKKANAWRNYNSFP